MYYISSLQSNIISLGQLSEDGYKITLKGDNLWVHEEQGTLFMKVKRSMNRLYKILLYSGETECLLARSKSEDWLWHLRLGHVNFKAMKLMSTTNMVHGMPKIKQQAKVCTGCLMSKQTRKAFPHQSNFSAKKPLELVHGDLCGPITPSTPGGNRYIFLLIDDYSRVMWTYLLKNKSETFDAFKRFRALVENSPEKRIMTFRTDNGGEFTSKEFTKYCEEAGIVRHFTTPYSPQQNGVVERRNRTMIEMARSLLKEMNMPNYFWGEAIRHSTYLLNRLPTRAVTGITPCEAWSKEKPHVEHIRVFGCVAYMKLPCVNLKKLDSRSKPVIYLGKEPGVKAFRLYDPETKSVCVSRDVVFEERKAWNWGEKADPQVTQAGTFTVLINNSEVPEVLVDSNQADGDTSESTTEGDSSDSTTGTTSNITQSPMDSDTSVEMEERPKRYRRLSEIYNVTEQIELEDDELYLMGVDEPMNYKEAAKQNE